MPDFFKTKYKSTEKELLQDGYLKFGQFAKKHDLKVEEVATLAMTGKIKAVLDDTGRGYIPPDETIELTGMEKEHLKRQSRLYYFQKREGIEHVRSSRNKLMSAYEDYENRVSLGEKPDIYYCFATRDYKVLTSEPENSYNLTKALIHFGISINIDNLLEEQRYAVLDMMYSKYRVKCDYKVENRKTLFDNLEEAKTEAANLYKTGYDKIYIWHHGYQYYKYENGELIQEILEPGWKKMQLE